MIIKISIPIQRLIELETYGTVISTQEMLAEGFITAELNTTLSFDDFWSRWGKN
jgi:hypothetical protein